MNEDRKDLYPELTVPAIPSLPNAETLSFGAQSIGASSKTKLRLGSDVFGNDSIMEVESHKGIMQKQCPSFKLLWQNRYFVLKHRMLRYYKNEDDYKQGKPPRGILNFQQVNFEFESRMSSGTAYFALKPTGCNRVFNLKCSTSDADTWEEAI